MKRDPSIHVRLSLLSKIAAGIGLTLEQAELLVTLCRKHSCDIRSVSITNEKALRNINRLTVSNKGDTSLASEIIYSVRVKMKHIGVTRIKEGDRDWLQLKELTKLLNNFCSTFNIEARAGYIEYIRLGFNKISSMHSHISKLISMYESICQEYDAKVILDQDKEPGKTKAIHDDYVNLIASKTGVKESYLNKPLKMLMFLKVKEICNELNIEPEIWIDAQFEALEFCNGLPTPEALVGDKAMERLNKFLYENNISTKKEKVIDTQFWDKLKTKEKEE